MKAFTDSQGNDWTCTDPDNLQYGRRISEKIFEFKEFDRFDNQEEFENLKELGDEAILASIEGDNEWCTIYVNLNQYSEQQINYEVSAYYGSIKSLRELYSQCDESELNWIIAECIFEQESGMY